MALNTTTGTGTQATTQSPQSAGTTASGGTNSSSVQPGTASSLLTNDAAGAGVPLGSNALTTVSLAGGTTSQTQAVSSAPTKHHANPALFGFSVVLFVLAIALFWFTARSEKNTTI